MLQHSNGTNSETFELSGATYQQPPPIFVVEAVPGGFIVSGNNGAGRQVARNVHAVGRLLREWAPKEPKKEPEPANG